CPRCKVKYRPDPALLRKVNLPAEQITSFYRPREGAAWDEGGEEAACPQCDGTGYFGRTGIFELMVVTERVREQVRDDFNPWALRQEAAKAGMESTQADGLRQVIAGQTSIQELLRVCK